MDDITWPEMASAWYNYRTKEHDFITGWPKNLEDYIPGIPAAHNLFRLYIDMGYSPADAYINVLKTCLEEK